MNQTGTALLLTDAHRSTAKAAVVQEWSNYCPYGYLTPIPGRLILSGFNGENRDPQTGHYWLGNGYRILNTVLRRFQSVDSLSPFGIGGLNSYVYSGGDPINYSDPTGHVNVKLLGDALELVLLSRQALPKIRSRLQKIKTNKARRLSRQKLGPHATTDDPALSQGGRVEKFVTDYKGITERYQFDKSGIPTMQPFKTTDPQFGTVLDIRHFEAAEEYHLIYAGLRDVKAGRSLDLASHAAVIRDLKKDYIQTYGAATKDAFTTMPP